MHEHDAHRPQIRLTRTVPLPDPVQLARCRKAPELGPRILFFSGGTALRETSRSLVPYTHNSIHLITAFDSGGSSAHLRKAFRMLAVGDLRNRLLSLADQTVRGQPEIFALFVYRFPTDASQPALRKRLHRMAAGRDAMVRAVPDPMRTIIQNHLREFEERLPRTFDLRGANIGNLILTGGYLSQRRRIDPVCFLFSRLAEVRGVVRPIVSQSLHLVAELRDGRTVVGQHRLTGKEVAPLDAPIRRIYLARNQAHPAPVTPPLRPKVEQLIRSAELICYPMGSFYTSVLPNLLVDGVGRAVADTDVPKVYVPNTGHDPEMFGLSLSAAAQTLVRTLRASGGGHRPAPRLLSHVLLDASAPLRTADRKALRRSGVAILRAPLVTPASAPYIDGQRLVEMLISLAR